MVKKQTGCKREIIFIVKDITVMNDYKNIDDFFRDKGSGLNVTPSDNVWDNLDQELFNAGRRRKRILLYTILAAILLISGSVLILNYSSIDNDTDIISSGYEQQDNQSTEKNITTSESDTYNNTGSKMNEEITEDIILPTDDDFSITVNSRRKTESNNNIDITGDEEKYVDFDFHHKDKNRSHLSLSGLNNRNIVSLYNDYTHNINDRQIVTIEEYIERRRKIHMYTGASASFGIMYYPSTEDQTTWTSDLIYGLKLNKFYIETGIGYQKMKEQGAFRIDYRTHDSIGYYNKVLSFEVDPNDPNEITYNTKTTTVYDSIDHFLLKSPIYKYDYLVFPVKFGYKFFNNSQITISAETGIVYSLLTKTYSPVVSYENTESQLVSITNNTPDRVAHNFRIHLALRLNYKITKTISISTQPEFTSFINSIYTNKSSDKLVKPYTMGIRFGIYFDF